MMARGGKRPGAGRPRGSTGPTGRTIARRKLVDEILTKYEVTPLEIMLDMVTGKVPYDRELLDAAHKAAPYVHPRIAPTVDVEPLEDNRTVKEYTTEELTRMLRDWEEQCVAG